MERTVATGVQEKGESRQDRGFQRFSELVLDPAWNYLPLYFSLDINLLQFPFILTPLWFLLFLWKNFSSKTTKTSFSSTKMFTECALTNYFRKSVFLKNLISSLDGRLVWHLMMEGKVEKSYFVLSELAISGIALDLPCYFLEKR